MSEQSTTRKKNPRTLKALPRPGKAAAARRVSAVAKAGDLPPPKLLSLDELKKVADKVLPGEWYNLPLPTSLQQLNSVEFGAEWLTKAFHAAGSLGTDNRVTKILSFKELDVQGVDAQGGAGRKAIATVEYELHDSSLHTKLFIKCPWEFDGAHGEHNRVMAAQIFGGDGDARELEAYQLLEGLLPMPIPKFYFADLTRASCNYLLITECIPFKPRETISAATFIDWRDTPPGQVLPQIGKYQDDRLLDPHLYYFALFKAMARMAAADKRGIFDEHIERFGGQPKNASVPAKSSVSKDTPERRATFKRRAEKGMDTLIEFVMTYGFNLFPAPINTLEWLLKTKKQIAECYQYRSAVNDYLYSQDDLIALAHPNLQVDNGYYWREAEDSTELECGLFDWFGLRRVPVVSIWAGSCLYGCDPDVLHTHCAGLMEAFASEYHNYGGPKIDSEELHLMFHLAWVNYFISLLATIETEIYVQGPSKEEWPSITDVWDGRIMGTFNVRARVVTILQSLRYWEKSDIHSEFMAWVNANEK